MEKLKIAYPDAYLQGDFIIIDIIDGVTVMFREDIENNEYNAWDNKGTDLTDKLKKAIDDVNNLPYKQEDKLVLIFEFFRDSFGKIAGFNTDMVERNDFDFPKYDGKNDKVWEILKIKYNVNVDRKLHIYTYGTTFMFHPPKNCQMVFNSCVLRGSQANKPEKFGLGYKSLLKLRGTNLKVQQEVRGAKLFIPFMEDLVANIEDNDLDKIAIVCRAGHHRSVSCAEMLGHLYPNRTVEHLTINN